MRITAEKLEQATAILDEFDVDLWMTFVRETTDGGDPVLPLILDQSLTWQSALLITRAASASACGGGRRTAIVGTHDAEAISASGDWSNVVGYVEGIADPLLEIVAAVNPSRIAVNHSTDDVKADGLTHGMYLLLCEHLAEFADRFISAAPIINALRSRKSATEVERIRRAIATAEIIFDEVGRFASPGTSEVEIAEFMRNCAARRGVDPAWDPAGCPIVTTGPDSMSGHAVPSRDLHIRPGCMFNLDFGVRENGYCSDLQRAWYVPRNGEDAPPADVQRAFDTVRAAIEAAKAAVRPGAPCWTVDAAARQVVIDAGYPEYDHATGHHVGRSAHDGGGVLGPRWPRYGRTPEYQIEPGNVFTLELGIANVSDRGYLGLEEIVLVTDDGCEYLSNAQTTLPLLGR